MRKAFWIPVVLVLIGVEAFQSWQLYRLRKDLEDVQWNAALQDRESESTITPDVGTIQFLKKGGYSISLDTAKYSGDGLNLRGFVGNPTQLWISNLTMKFV